jgi:outer membrane biosynthesis protein TonB
MSPDRAEMAGTGAAIVFHIALIAALSTSLAHIAQAPEPPSMEVELVDDVGLQSAAPQTVPTPPPPSEAPEMGQAIEPAPTPPPESVTAPPIPAPKPVVTPQASQKPQKPTATPRQAKPAPPKSAPRVSRIGDDFLKGIAGSDAPSRPAQPSGATFDAKAKASVAALFQRLVQPCADNQVNPGRGANRIRVTVNLRLRPNGSLASASVVRVSGVDDDNASYEERVKDLAVAVYRECAPFRGLPSDLYKTDQGGWSNINLTYKLP